MRRVDAPVADALGLILIQHQPLPDGSRLPKGTMLGPDDVDRLIASGVTQVRGVALEDGEAHEEEGSARIATAAAGSGLTLGAPAESQIEFLAQWDGVLRVNESVMTALNRIPDVAVFSLLDQSVVRAGQAVGAAKALPLAIPVASLEAVERITAALGSALWVDPFRPTESAVLVRDRVGERTLDKFRQVATTKLASYHSRVWSFEVLGDDPAAIGAVYRRAADAGCALIVTAGGASADPADPSLVALQHAGATMVANGAPVYPGTQFWIAYLGDTAIMAVSSCGALARASLVDMLAPRVFVGERITKDAMAALGHGGFIREDMPSRFPRWTLPKKSRTEDAP